MAEKEKPNTNDWGKRNYQESKNPSLMSGDLVAKWNVPLADGNHLIEFEHGTTTGKRVVRVDGKEIKREDWMFKLVGKEHFHVGKVKCSITIEAVSGFAYEYSLEVNGKCLEKFSENQTKVMKSWIMSIDSVPTRVVLEKDTLDIWVNGRKVESSGEFTDNGTETHFAIGNHDCRICCVSSGHRRKGVIHSLLVDDNEIPEAKE